MASRASGKIGIIGSGLIGRSWAMLFASVGYDVAIYDVQRSQIDNALVDIKNQLHELQKSGMLKGTLNVDEQFAKIKPAYTVAECVKGAKYVQECTPEVHELKKKIFKDLDDHVDNGTILASSTSCLLPSTFTADLKHRDHVIVVHPVNPPYYVPLVELIPAPWTKPDIVATVRNLMVEIGQAPVTIKKEIDGFVLNRLQYAIITEAWRLLEADIISTKDLDTVMSEGLGMRYAFLGPIETTHLNAEGILEYMQKFSGGISRVANAFGPVPEMGKGPTLERVNRELTEDVPVDKLQERRQWRDRRIAALAKLKRDMKGN